MSRGVYSLIGRVADRRSLQRWTRLADLAGSLDFSELRMARQRAGDLRREIDRLCRAADSRISSASGVVEAPAEADWSWRPQIWCQAADFPGKAAIESGVELGEGLALFHDCKVSELTVRQVVNRAAEDIAAYAMRLDVFRFDGSFLSLAIDLPPEAIEGMTKRHLIGVTTRLGMERPLEIFARLNIRHGPNTEQLVREIAPKAGEATVEFDLAYCALNEKRLEKAWLDLIFEGPEMNQVELRDLTMYRRPRAEI